MSRTNKKPTRNRRRHHLLPIAAVALSTMTASVYAQDGNNTMPGMQSEFETYKKSEPATPTTTKAATPPIITSNSSPAINGEEIMQITVAEAELKPTSGHKAKGVVHFYLMPIKEGEKETGKRGIRIVAQVEGLTPNQQHGFHIHEYGDCSDDGTAAGGHFNPSGFLHGSPDSPTRHVGDLGNLQADAQGVAHYERIDKVIDFAGPNSIIGKAIIIHAKADDFTTQPSGNSGARIACGTIRSVKTEKVILQKKELPSVPSHTPPHTATSSPTASSSPKESAPATSPSAEPAPAALHS